MIMPRVKREQLPLAIFWHLTQRVRERSAALDDLDTLRHWLDRYPLVPEGGAWFKRFGTFTLCGEGEIPKTFLTADQTPYGEEVP